MTYDGKGRLLTVTDALTNLSELEYDSNGNVLRVTDAKLRQTLFSYDDKNRLVGVENAAGDSLGLAYDTMGRVTSTVDGRGLRTLFSYNPEGLLDEVTTPDGQRTTMSYDTVNRLVALTGPNGNQEALELMILVSAGNLFRNPSFENVDPNRTDGPDHWYQSNGLYARETGDSHTGAASVPLSVQVPWTQSKLDLPEGASFVARAMVKRAPISLKLEAKVRNLEGGSVSLSQSEALETSFDDWASSDGFKFQVVAA